MRYVFLFTTLTACAQLSGADDSAADQGPQVLVLENGSPKLADALGGLLDSASLRYRRVSWSKEKQIVPELRDLAETKLLILALHGVPANKSALAQLHDYFASGRPAIAIGKSALAFSTRRNFFPTYFGGHYLATRESDEIDGFVPADQETHALLSGLRSRVKLPGSFRVTHPLSNTATPLVLCRPGPGVPSQSYAWCNEYRPGQRLVYVANYDDERIENAFHRKLLLNAFEWCLDTSRSSRPARPLRIQPKPPERTVPPNATALFDGRHHDAWDWFCEAKSDQSTLRLDPKGSTFRGLQVFDSAQWTVEAGSLVARPSHGDVISRESFTDFRLSLDFLLPDNPDRVRDIWRSNSGVLLGGLYEIQILDSSRELRPNVYSCGAILGQRAPLRLACLRSGRWQRLVVSFRAARYRGKHRAEPAQLTATLNGIRIHTKLELREPSPSGLLERAPDTSGPLSSPIRLQSDSGSVRFANVFVEKMKAKATQDSAPNR